VRRLVLVVLLVLAGCAVDPAPRSNGTIAPTPERVERALRFAALAPLPADARVVRLESQGGIDTLVSLTVRVGAPSAAPWRAASGLPADGQQQRVANPDGALIHREIRTGPVGAGDVEVAVTAFTT
jgi:hypothetical protein